MKRLKYFGVENAERIADRFDLAADLLRSTQVVGQVLPFRTNNYVVEELIDWDAVPDDPLFQLTFLSRDMLDDDDYQTLDRAMAAGTSREDMARLVAPIRTRLNPHPAGQMTDNVPHLMVNGDKVPVPGIQHKYQETALLFPPAGQTCFAYCSFCFRWPQFVGDPDLKFAADRRALHIDYIREHTEITDVLITGGDPLTMRTRLLRQVIEPLLEIPNVRTIRLGTKVLSYWPYRFTSDKDADDLLRLFEEVVESGRHLAFMAHFNHPRELATKSLEEAVQRVRGTGAVIRSQSPVLRRINDDADTWADMWRRQVALGIVPYYMFVERDTGPKEYFEIPLAETHRIYVDAMSQVSGLARTARGPSMSAHPGKVVVDGIVKVAGEKVFALRFLQARDPRWLGKPFFATYDPEATWLSDLEPAFDEPDFFFERNSSDRPVIVSDCSDSSTPS